MEQEYEGGPPLVLAEVAVYKWLLLLLAVLPRIIIAQTTTVTGAVTDANGNPYFPGTVSAYINLASGQPLPPGVPASGSIGPFPTTAGGNFVVVVASPFSWSFTICGTPPDIGPKGNPNPKQVCFTTPAIPISGLSQSIIPNLGPIPLLGPGGGTGGAVSSVFGRTGPVIAVTNDYNFNQLAGSVACSQQQALTGDTTSPVGTCTTTTSGLNGVSLAGLPTGPIKNTTGTGIPSIAVAGDISNLWSGACTSATFLRGDGQCQTPPGSGTVTNTLGPLAANDFVLGNGGVDTKDSGFSIVPSANGGSGVANPTIHGIPFAEGALPFNFGCTSVLTGQLLTANNAADPTCNSPGIGGGDINSATYTVKCDSGITLLDRAHILRFVTTAPTVTMPDPTASGCGNNFVVGIIASGVTVTVNRTTTATFNIYNGITPVTGATSFTLTSGQYAVLNSMDNANWTVRETTGAANPSFDKSASGLLNPTADSTFTQSSTSVSGWTLAGTAPASTANATGTTATSLFNVNGVTGGADSNATGIAGIGSSPTISAGTGGAGTGTNTVGGAGGSVTLNAGNGGASNGTGANSNGGNIILTPGTFGSGGSGTAGHAGVLQVGAAECTVPGTAGGFCAGEGTEPVNVSGAATLIPDSATHEWMAATNGASTSTPGMLVRRQPSPINQTTQTAAISTATLCAAAAGACNITGQYHVHFNFWGSGTACATPGPGAVTFLLTWTDENGTAHSAVSIQMLSQNGSTTSTSMQSSFTFATALNAESAGGDFTFSTNGTVIQYATGYTACTTGTGTYNLRAAITRVQ